MAHLIGVSHGEIHHTLFASKVVPVSPTEDLLDFLREREPSKVALEYLSEEDISLVRRMTDLDYNTFPGFWNPIIDAIHGHEIIYLEEPNVWFSHAEAIGKEQEIRRKHERPPWEELGSIRDTLVAVEDVYNARLEVNRIHLLERDKVLLRNIGRHQPDIVIAGKGHTDYWKLNPAALAKNDVSFHEYSTDHALGTGRVFEMCAQPDPCTAYDFTSLRKALRLKEKGSFSDEAPDYVGVWDIAQPSRGYFELFLNQGADVNDIGSLVSGRIEDVLGSATFSGRVQPSGIHFVKNYRERTTEALSSPVVFEASDGGNMWQQGTYRGSGGEGPYYMVRSSGENPLILALEFHNRYENPRQMSLF